jgi:hypothetical protein
VPGAELRQSYLAWFGWCQQALGGDAISLHAATMEIIVPRPWRREAELALELLAPSTGQLGSAGIIR